jgi:ubiquinone/menaquinone biosynthesis C-methylase UbiE
MRTHILRATGLDSTAGRILEVGCGTGAVLHSLAESTPATLYGLDHNFSYLQEAQSNTAGTRLTCGDALRLPYAANSLDASVCHFLLLWLADPAQALQEMTRVVKTGGWVIAFAEPDHTGRIDHPAALQSLGARQTTALRQQGANPAIGRVLRGLFAQAGLQNIQAGLISGHWTAEFTPQDWQQEWDIIQADLENTLPNAELQHLKEIDRAAWQSGERILYIPTFYAWGQVP